MPRLSHHAVFAIVFSLLLSAGAESAAPEARKLLGQGVHSLYQGRLFEAIEDFDVASIDLPQDPRVYFFRGVAKMRIGQRDDAIFDFQRGAQLEALLGRRDIGRSLERIQGYERFQIERYRLAARRLAQAGELLPPDVVVRNRSQDRQPENRVVVAEIPAEDDLPNDANDPFASDSNGLLGRGASDQNMNVVEPPRPELNNDSDVAAEFEDDAFGAEDNPFPVDPEIAEESNKTDSSGSGAFGAVFRALTRSAIPGTTEQRKNVIEGIRGTVPLPNGDRGPSEEGFPEQPGDDADPFGNDSDPFGSDNEPFGSGNAEMSDEEDPFGNDTPTDDGQGTDDATDDADPFADDADPFADEEDPFGN